MSKFKLFDIDDILIGVKSDYKNFQYRVTASDLCSVRVIAIDENAPGIIKNIWISNEFFKLDKQHYRNIKIDSILKQF
jgi:hypothetical protein